MNTNHCISVLVPAYNEEKHIAETIDGIVEAVSSIFGQYEIIVVDDGSEDNTREELRAVASSRENIGFVSYDRNQGKGFALKRGFQEATGDYVLFTDADPDISSDQIKRFVETFQHSDGDIVVGSKYHPDSTIEYPLKRKILSIGYRTLTSTLFDINIRDTQVGMKLIDSDVLENIFPLMRVKDFAFDVELLALSSEYGYNIVESPVDIEFEGSSSVDWKAIIKIGLDTASVFYRQKLADSYNSPNSDDRQTLIDTDNPVRHVEVRQPNNQSTESSSLQVGKDGTLITEASADD